MTDNGVSVVHDSVKLCSQQTNRNELEFANCSARTAALQPINFVTPSASCRPNWVNLVQVSWVRRLWIAPLESISRVQFSSVQFVRGEHGLTATALDSRSKMASSIPGWSAFFVTCMSFTFDFDRRCYAAVFNILFFFAWCYAIAWYYAIAPCLSVWRSEGGIVYIGWSDVTEPWPRYDRHFVGITWHNVWS